MALSAARPLDAQVNVLNRLGGSTGTAVFTIVLQQALTGADPSAAAAATAYGDAATTR